MFIISRLKDYFMITHLNYKHGLIILNYMPIVCCVSIAAEILQQHEMVNLIEDMQNYKNAEKTSSNPSNMRPLSIFVRVNGVVKLYTML